MTDTGLSNRLRHHSRRAGLNVGLSMALAIAICILGFATIYAQLSPVWSDFVGQDSPDPVQPIPDGDRAAAVNPNPEDPTPVSATAGQPEPTAVSEQPTVAPTSPANEFDPDLQSNSIEQVNLRSSPGVGNNVLTTLPLAAPLQTLGDEETIDGQLWIRVRTEDGEEGWIFSNATETYDPNA